MIRVSRLSVLSSAVLILLFASLMSTTGAESPIDLIVQADFLYMTRYVEEDMTQAIALFEAVIPDLDTLSMNSQSYVLNRLSQLYYEATMFSEGDTSEDGELFEKGKAYGLQSLRLNAEFAEAEGNGFNAAIAFANDAAALHWAASNWGKLCGMNPIVGLTQQDSVLALFSRAVEIDSDYWGGSASSSLGSLLIMSPSTLGGDEDAGLALVEDSITIDPSYLSNRVVLAEYWGFTYNFFGQLTGVRDAELIERELTIVLDAEVGDWFFWNLQAKALAAKLLAQLQEMTE
jgi:hypothetical protein